MRRSLTLLIHVFTLTACATSNGSATQVKAPYWHPDSLGAALNSHYKALTDSCLPVPRLDATRNLLPTPVATFPFVDPTRAAFTVLSGGASAAKAFGLIVEVNSLSSLVDPANLNSPEKFVSELAMLPPEYNFTAAGSTALARSDTCDTAVGAALTVSGAWGETAKIQSAFQAQDQRQNELLVFMGTFWSPLAAAMASSTVADGVAPRLILWDYFSANPLAATNPRWYLKGFRGALVYRGEQDKANTDARVSGSANVSGLVSIKGDMSAEFKRGHTTNVTIHGVYIYRGPDTGWNPDALMASVPTPTDIATWFNNKTARANNIDPVLLQGQGFSHHVTLDGIPDSHCRPGAFSVAGNSSVSFQQGAGAVFSARPCTLSMVYQPADGIFVPGASTHSFAYSIQYGTSIGANSISIPVAATAPIGRDIYVGSPLATYRPDALTASQAIWKVALSVADPRSRIVREGDPNDNRQGTATVATSSDCSDVSGLSATVALPAAGGVVTVTGTPPTGRVFGAEGRWCTARIDISLPTRAATGIAAGRFPQQLTTTIYYPAILPAAPAAPIAPPPG